MNERIDRHLGPGLARKSLMLPIESDELRLVDIAEYWSREGKGIRPADEIFEALIAAFWRGEIRVRYGKGAPEVRPIALLRVISRNREHPGFLFIEPGASDRPVVTKHPDGSVEIYNPNCIVLPSDPSGWDETILRTAYDRLAALSVNDLRPEIRPAWWGWA